MLRISLIILVLSAALALWFFTDRDVGTNVGAADVSIGIKNRDGAYEPVDERPLVFPDDHGAHPGVQNESWRLSGMLRDREGRRYGFQTAFYRWNPGNNRARRASAWATGNVYRGQFALTLEHGKTMTVNSRISRDALGLAGYRADRRRLWLHDWRLELSPTADGNSDLSLAVGDRNEYLQVALTPLKPVIEMPISKQMRLYGISRLQAQGQLRIDGLSRNVSGIAFYDHAWGEMPITGGQLVWNRFWLHLSNGDELVILQSRRRDGSGTPIDSGFWIDADAKLVELKRQQIQLEVLAFWRHQSSGIRYPVAWRLTLPAQHLTLTIRAMVNNQQINDGLADWSGGVFITGTLADEAIRGSGLMQLDGYRPAP